MDRALSMHARSSTSLIYPLATTLLWESAIKNRDLPCLQIRGLPYLWNSVRDKVREDRVDSNWFKWEAHKVKSLIQSEIWELPTTDWRVSWQFSDPFTWWLCYASFLFLYELSSDFQFLTLPFEIISDLKKNKSYRKYEFLNTPNVSSLFNYHRSIKTVMLTLTQYYEFPEWMQIPLMSFFWS